MLRLHIHMDSVRDIGSVIRHPTQEQRRQLQQYMLRKSNCSFLVGMYQVFTTAKPTVGTQRVKEYVNRYLGEESRI